MRAFPVRMPSGARYWTVLDEELAVVTVADSFLRLLLVCDGRRPCRLREPAGAGALLLADFDPDVVAIAAQPFLLSAAVGGRVRRHVPDFLLVRTNRTVQVVNVKPAARLADPVVAEALA